MRQDVEELASDTFVALWQSADTITSGRLRGWLGRVARNRAVSFLRRQHLRFAQQEDVFCVDDRDAQRLLEEKERRALVQQALLALSDEDRELMLRRYFYNQSAEQIAREKLGMEKVADGQTSYISLTQNDEGTVVQAEKTPNLLDRIWQALQSLFS